jgi:hypothetical protein
MTKINNIGQYLIKTIIENSINFEKALLKNN